MLVDGIERGSYEVWRVALGGGAVRVGIFPFVGVYSIQGVG
jgi:hypothetical protein